MKNYFMRTLIFTFFISFAFLVQTCYGQTILITKMSKEMPVTRKDKEPMCFTTDFLENISTEMFQNGNPKYIWVDLVKDGYVTAGDGLGYNLYLYHDSKEQGGTIAIPEEIQQEYLKKWYLFLNTIHEPAQARDRDYLHLFSGVLCKDISDPTSDFRKITQPELSQMNLNTRGELRFLQEFVNDGLAPLDKPLHLAFGNKGYYVNGTRMNPIQREKYAALCKEIYGTDYSQYNQGIIKSPEEDNTLGNEINKYKQLIATTK